MLTMSLLSKFSKVENNFLGQCDCLTWHKFLSLQNPALFRILAFSRIYEVPTMVKAVQYMSAYMKYLPLLTTLKENGGPSETNQNKTLEGAFLRW